MSGVRLRKEFDEAFASTRLPERPNYAWANEFLVKSCREGAKQLLTLINPKG